MSSASSAATMLRLMGNVARGAWTREQALAFGQREPSRYWYGYADGLASAAMLAERCAVPVDVRAGELQYGRDECADELERMALAVLQHAGTDIPAELEPEACGRWCAITAAVAIVWRSR